MLDEQLVEDFNEWVKVLLEDELEGATVTARLAEINAQAVIEFELNNTRATPTDVVKNIVGAILGDMELEDAIQEEEFRNFLYNDFFQISSLSKAKTKKTVSLLYYPLNLNNTNFLRDYWKPSQEINDLSNALNDMTMVGSDAARSSLTVAAEYACPPSPDAEELEEPLESSIFASPTFLFNPLSAQLRSPQGEPPLASSLETGEVGMMVNADQELGSNPPHPLKLSY